MSMGMIFVVHLTDQNLQSSWPIEAAFILLESRQNALSGESKINLIL